MFDDYTQIVEQLENYKPDLDLCKKNGERGSYIGGEEVLKYQKTGQKIGVLNFLTTQHLKVRPVSEKANNK